MGAEIEAKLAHQKSAERADNEWADAEEQADPRRMPRSATRTVSAETAAAAANIAGHEQLTPQTGRGEVAAAAQIERRRQRVDAEVHQSERQRDAQEQQVAKAPGGDELRAQQPAALKQKSVSIISSAGRSVGA